MKVKVGKHGCNTDHAMIRINGDDQHMQDFYNRQNSKFPGLFTDSGG